MPFNLFSNPNANEKPKKAKKGPVDKEYLGKLAKHSIRPKGGAYEGHDKKNVSASFSDLKHCTFKPTITKSKSNQGSEPFQKRLESYVKKREIAKKKVHELNPSIYTFKPQISSNKEFEVDGTFLDRLSNDVEARRAEHLTRSTKELCSFTPQLFTRNHKKKDAHPIAPFDDRTKEDIEARLSKREANEARRIAMDMQYPYAPQLRKKTPNPNFNSFLARMEADLSARDERRDKVNKLLSTKPKISMNYSSAGKRR